MPNLVLRSLNKAAAFAILVFISFVKETSDERMQPTYLKGETDSMIY